MSLAVTAVTALCLGLFLVWERRRPAFSPQGGMRRILRNVGLGVGGLGTSFLVVTPISLLAAEYGLGWRSGWPMPLRLLTDLLILEVFIYWWHRALHEVPFLWRFHRVHHYDEFLDVTSSFRFHPGELVMSALVRGSLVFLLDVSVPAILLFDGLVLIAAGFHHSNAELPRSAERWLRPFIVTPGHHRIHHIPERRFTDSNYGTLLTVWDRLFGSWQERERRGRYGVEGASDRNLGRLAVDPFTND